MDYQQKRQVRPVAQLRRLYGPRRGEPPRQRLLDSEPLAAQPGQCVEQPPPDHQDRLPRCAQYQPGHTGARPPDGLRHHRWPRLREGRECPSSLEQRVHPQLDPRLHFNQECAECRRSPRRGIRVHLQRPGVPGGRVLGRHHHHRPVPLPQDAQEHHQLALSAHVAPDDEKRLLAGRLSDTKAEVQAQHQIPLRHHRHANQLPARAGPQQQVVAPGDEPRPYRQQRGEQPRRLLRLYRRLHHHAADRQGHLPRRGAFRQAPRRENRQPGAGREIRLPGALRLDFGRGAPVCRQKQIHTLGRVYGLGRVANPPQRHERAPWLGNRNRRRRAAYRELRLYRRLRHGHSHHHQPEHYRLGAEHQRHPREPVALLDAAQDPPRPRPAVPAQQEPQPRRNAAPFLREGTAREGQHRRRDRQQLDVRPQHGL